MLDGMTMVGMVCTDGNNTKKKEAFVQRQKIAQAIHEVGGSVDEQRSVVQKVARALSEIVDGKSVNIRRGLMKQIAKFKQQALESTAPAAPAGPPLGETTPAPAAPVAAPTTTEKAAPEPQGKEDEDDGLKFPPQSPVVQPM